MANRPKQPRRRKNPPSSEPKPRPAPALLVEMTRMLPREWRRSPAWKHFQTAQVEFLTGMQLLLNECLERIKLPDEERNELRRIAVEK